MIVRFRGPGKVAIVDTNMVKRVDVFDPNRHESWIHTMTDADDAEIWEAGAKWDLYIVEEAHILSGDGMTWRRLP